MTIASLSDEDTPAIQPRCLFCGEPEELEIWDMFTDGTFTLWTCCPGLMDSVATGLHDDPAWGRELLRRLGAEALTGYRLRRVTDGQGSTPMLDWQLRLVDVTFSAARAFVARHHGHCAPPVTWRWCHGVANGSQLVGVALTGNPVAPAYMHRGIAEVNRLCVRRDVAPMLCWNAASMLLAEACRVAERHGFKHIVTYTRAGESGVSLRAAGWVCEGRAGGRSWISPKRPRRNASGWIPKLRWSRALRPRPPTRPRMRPDTTVTEAEPLWLGERDAA